MSDNPKKSSPRPGSTNNSGTRDTRGSNPSADSGKFGKGMSIPKTMKPPKTKGS